MEYVDQLIDDSETVLDDICSILGFVGFVFGLRHDYEERTARKQLEGSQQKLDNALGRLKHLEKSALGLEQYPVAV
jgi:hypothetical protein